MTRFPLRALAPVIRNWTTCSVVIFILAFAIRLILGLSIPAYNDVDNVELTLIAKSVAQGKGFAYPFSETVDTGPSAFYPPSYVLLHAANFRLFGSGRVAARVMIFISCLVAALLCSSLIWFARIAGLPAVTGASTAVAASIMPLHAWLEIKGTYEHALTALWIILLVGLMVGNVRDAAFGSARAAGIGALAGVGVSFSPALLAVIIGLLAVGLVKVGLGQARYWRYAAAVLLLAICFQIPWALRNWQVLGRPILLRDDFGFELWHSNNPVAAPDFSENIATGLKYAQHPFVSPEGLQEAKSLGELQYFDVCASRAYAWIRNNPRQFARLTFARTVLFWFPHMLRPWQTIIRRFITSAAILGLVLLFRERNLLAYAVLAVWLCYPPVYYLVSSQDRYAYPIYPLQLLLSVYAITTLLRMTRIAGLYSLNPGSFAGCSTLIKNTRGTPW